MFRTKTNLIIIFSFALLSAPFIKAQDSTSNAIETPNPIVLFNKAKDNIAQKKRKEAREILEKLLLQFPNDFEIRGLYLEAVGAIVSNEVYREKALQALDLFNKVPFEDRTENFYERYSIVTRDLKKPEEFYALKEEIIKKFPRSRFAANLRFIEATKEKDVLKAAKMFEDLIKDFENEKGSWGLWESYFELIAQNFSKFDAQKTISVAKKLEDSKLQDLIGESSSKSPITTASGYLQMVLKISGKLREKYPLESLRFAQNGLTFFENKKSIEGIEDYGIIFRQAIFRSYLVLKDWENAKRKGIEIIKWANNSNPIEEVDEAKFRRDYAVVLQNLRQFALAREQFFIALVLDKDYEKEWKEFNLKYTLSPVAKNNFEKAARAKFEKFLTSREAVIKANLLKTEQAISANDFLLTDFSGKTVSLKSYQGKVLVLSFWATWCVPCVKELEEMKVAYEKHKNNPKIAFAVVSIDKEKESVPIAAKKRNYQFPIFYAGDKIESDYKIESIPKLFIIDSQGKIRFQKSDYESNGYYLKELNWMIEKVLK